MNVPNHIAVVLDGNRRWAQKNGLLPWKGHEKGANTFENFLNWCLELNVPCISAYVLSTENLKRPKKEVDEILRIAHQLLVKWVNDGKIFDKYEVRVKFCGDLKRLPPNLLKLMEKLMQKTARYRKKLLNIMIAYGGKFELTNTFRKIAEKILKSGRIQITQRDIERNLLVPTPVDLVIRTGGMSRLSNFLLWQTAYAEMYITKTLWPDFSKREFMKAIEWYNSSKRNFGK